jgi:hypothetical protein
MYHTTSHTTYRGTQAQRREAVRYKETTEEKKMGKKNKAVLKAQEEENVATQMDATEETQVTESETAEAGESVVKKKSKFCISDTTLEILKAGRKDRDTVVKEALEKFKAIGQVYSIHEHVLTEESIRRLMNAMLRGIETEKRGWWSEYVVEESDEWIQVVEKKTDY